MGHKASGSCLVLVSTRGRYKAHCIPMLIPLDTGLSFKCSQAQIHPAKKIYRSIFLSAHNVVMSHGTEPTNSVTWCTNPAHLVAVGRVFIVNVKSTSPQFLLQAEAMQQNLLQYRTARLW